MILVKSYVYDKVGRKLGEYRTVRNDEEDSWDTTVIITEFDPDGPDVVTFRSWDAKSARVMHLGCARAMAGRDGTVRTELPGLEETSR